MKMINADFVDKVVVSSVIVENGCEFALM